MTISDRYSGYSFIPLEQRQACFAHLIRDFRRMAERAVRPVVIHRKTSLGSQSERGSEFVARMQTIAATLRQKGASYNVSDGAYVAFDVRGPVSQGTLSDSGDSERWTPSSAHSCRQ